METPDVRYTWSGDFAIAYQVFGEGPGDLVYLPQFISNVAWNWQVPDHARFLRRLGSFSRVVVMDPRNVGASDGPAPKQPTTLEDRVDDVMAVIGATMTFKTTLFGGGRSAFIAMLAAAMYPARFDGLVLFAPTPSWRQSEELPWQESASELEQMRQQIERSASSQLEWGTSWVRRYAPSLPASSIPAIATYGSLTAGMGGQLTDQELYASINLGPILPTIRVPTLVLHRTEDPLEPVAGGRLVAQRIPGAKLVELPGRDALPWIGEADAVLDEIEIFLTGERRAPEPDRRVTTVLFTDVVDSTATAASMGHQAWREVQAAHDRIVRDELDRARGREVKTMGDGFLATFDGPARAIACAVALAERTREIGIAVRAGVHTGEIEIVGDDVAGLGVAIGARVATAAGPSEVWVSQTVKDLVAGSGLAFEDAGEHELKGVPDRWRLYRVVS
jgi:class 3 adenylate cyclase